jgi:hypothetical protein
VDVGQYPEVEEPIVLTVDEVMKIFIKMLLVEGEPGLPSCRAWENQRQNPDQTGIDRAAASEMSLFPGK